VNYARIVKKEKENDFKLVNQSEIAVESVEKLALYLAISNLRDDVKVWGKIRRLCFKRQPMLVLAVKITGRSPQNSTYWSQSGRRYVSSGLRTDVPVPCSCTYI